MQKKNNLEFQHNYIENEIIKDIIYFDKESYELSKQNYLKIKINRLITQYLKEETI